MRGEHRSPTFAALSWLLFLSLLASVLACRSPGPSSAHTAELRASDPRVPIEFFKERFVFCRGLVNGHEVDMLLDSGAGVTVLSRSLADRLQLEGESDRRIQGSGGRQSVLWAEDVRIDVGPLTLRGLRTAVLDVGALEEELGRELPVILGREVFASCVVELDPARRTLALLDPASFEYAGGGTTLPFVPVNGGWITAARVNGLSLSLDVDTGSGANLILFPEFARRAGLLSEPAPEPTRYLLGVGGRTPIHDIVVDSFELGDREFTGLPAQIHAGDTGALSTSAAEGNLGAGVLYRFRTTFDAKARQLHLEGTRPPSD